jgi:dTDP-4-dehydrorhamnose reductase
MVTFKSGKDLNPMKVLLYGVTGMLGRTLFSVLSQDPSFDVFGTARCLEAQKIISNTHAEDEHSLKKAYHQVRPDVVINCIGLVKQLSDSRDPLKAISINALLPHRLSLLCQQNNARLLHISTDCVFSGKKGNYSENDLPDATDLYGRSKLLGEINEPHALTIRTSIIGHETSSKKGLVEWFLSQTGSVKGFKKALFSGLTTVELSKIIKEILIKHQNLHGLYHVAAHSITKYDLLKLIAQSYDKIIDIIEDETFIIDRSLNAMCFNTVSGYVPPQWPQLIEDMKNNEKNYHYCGHAS